MLVRTNSEHEQAYATIGTTSETTPQHAPMTFGTAAAPFRAHAVEAPKRLAELAQVNRSSVFADQRARGLIGLHDPIARVHNENRRRYGVQYGRVE